MSEKQTNQPEAPVAAIKDLYYDCVGLLAEFDSEAVVTPYGRGTLTETIITPDLDGRTLKLSWQKPSEPDDPTRVAEDFPLEQYDPETGKNLWHTPINIRVFDTATDKLLNDYWISNAGPTIDEEPESGDAYDEMRLAVDPDDPEDEYKMTADEVRLMGQLVEQATDEHERKMAFLEMYKSLDRLVSIAGSDAQLVDGKDGLPATFLTVQDAKDLGKSFQPDGLLYRAFVANDEGEQRKADIFLSNASTVAKTGILGRLVVYENDSRGVDQEILDIRPDNTVKGKWLHEIVAGDEHALESKDRGALSTEELKDVDNVFAHAKPRQ